VAFSRDLVPPVVEQVPGFSARIGKFDRFAPLNHRARRASRQTPASGEYFHKKLTRLKRDPNTHSYPFKV
jgi:hypothetical protein